MTGRLSLSGVPRVRNIGIWSEVQRIPVEEPPQQAEAGIENFATAAMSGGILYFRTTETLVAIA